MPSNGYWHRVPETTRLRQGLFFVFKLEQVDIYSCQSLLNWLCFNCSPPGKWDYFSTLNISLGGPMNISALNFNNFNIPCTTLNKPRNPETTDYETRRTSYRIVSLLPIWSSDELYSKRIQLISTLTHGIECNTYLLQKGSKVWIQKCSLQYFVLFFL